MGCRVGGRIMPQRDRACRRARGRQGRCAPLTRWPEDGPSLTAAARAGTGCAQVGTEGWRPSNKRMERESRSAGGPHLAPRTQLGEVLRDFPLPVPARCRDAREAEVGSRVRLLAQTPSETAISREPSNEHVSNQNAANFAAARWVVLKTTLDPQIEPASVSDCIRARQDPGSPPLSQVRPHDR